MYFKKRYLILTILLAALSLLPTTIVANEPMPAIQTADDSQLIARGYWGGGRGHWRGGDGYYGGGRGWYRGGGDAGWRGGGNYYYTSPRFAGYGYGYGGPYYSNYGGYGGGGGFYGGYRGGNNYCSSCGGFGFGF